VILVNKGCFMVNFYTHNNLLNFLSVNEKESMIKKTLAQIDEIERNPCLNSDNCLDDLNNLLKELSRDEPPSEIEKILAEIDEINKNPGLDYDSRLAKLNERLVELTSEEPVLPKKVEKTTDASSTCDKVEMARAILKSGHFLESYETSQLWGFTVGEAQGSKELRQQARLYTIDYPDVLDPETLKAAKSANKTNYCFLKLKRIGQAFSLIKNIETPLGNFGYEGFSEDFTIPMLASSLIRAETELGGDGKFLFAGEVLNRSFSNEWAPKEKLQEAVETIRNISSDDVVSIASGYAWHETHVLLFKGHLIYINKGVGQKGGINIYFNPNAHKMTMIKLTHLSERQKYSKENYFSEDKLISEFGLEHVLTVNLKKQNSGNCTYVSTRGAIRALMAIFWQLNYHDYSREGWLQAFAAIHEDYKQFVYFDRGLILDDLRDDRDDYEYLSRRELFADILRKIERKQYIYKSEHFEMLKFSAKKV